jgi:hypothetical protein
MVISGLIVYFVLNMDRLTSRSIGAASEALKTIKFKLEKDVASQMETGRDEYKDSPSADDEKSNLMKEKEPAETKKYFEIHLKGGTIIMTDSWWQQDNMIMYKQFGGSMGIEKSRIVRIVERQATRSDPSARF